jgi:hypothetical protein
VSAPEQRWTLQSRAKEVNMEIPDVFLYSDSLRKRCIAHCYGEPCAYGLHCASSEEWLRDNSMDTMYCVLNDGSPLRND